MKSITFGLSILISTLVTVCVIGSEQDPKTPQLHPNISQFSGNISKILNSLEPLLPIQNPTELAQILTEIQNILINNANLLYGQIEHLGELQELEKPKNPEKKIRGTMELVAEKAEFQILMALLNWKIEDVDGVLEKLKPEINRFYEEIKNFLTREPTNRPEKTLEKIPTLSLIPPLSGFREDLDLLVQNFTSTIDLDTSKHPKITLIIRNFLCQMAKEIYDIETLAEWDREEYKEWYEKSLERYVDKIRAPIWDVLEHFGIQVSDEKEEIVKGEMRKFFKKLQDFCAEIKEKGEQEEDVPEIPLHQNLLQFNQTLEILMNNFTSTFPDLSKESLVSRKIRNIICEMANSLYTRNVQPNPEDARNRRILSEHVELAWESIWKVLHAAEVRVPNKSKNRMMGEIGTFYIDVLHVMIMEKSSELNATATEAPGTPGTQEPLETVEPVGPEVSLHENLLQFNQDLEILMNTFTSTLPTLIKESQAYRKIQNIICEMANSLYTRNIELDPENPENMKILVEHVDLTWESVSKVLEASGVSVSEKNKKVLTGEMAKFYASVLRFMIMENLQNSSPATSEAPGTPGTHEPLETVGPVEPVGPEVELDSHIAQLTPELTLTIRKLMSSLPNLQPPILLKIRNNLCETANFLYHSSKNQLIPGSNNQQIVENLKKHAVTSREAIWKILEGAGVEESKELRRTVKQAVGRFYMKVVDFLMNENEGTEAPPTAAPTTIPAPASTTEAAKTEAPETGPVEPEKPETPTRPDPSKTQIAPEAPEAPKPPVDHQKMLLFFIVIFIFKLYFGFWICVKLRNLELSRRLDNKN